MSKINPMQLAALQAPTSPIAKSTTAKSTPAKTVITKSTAVKPATKTTVAKNKTVIKEGKDKPRKAKMERDSFTMPKDEYAQITLMKARLLALGQPTKKSELLRAGIKLLAAMSDNTLKTTLAAIPVIKTGRPNKS